MRVLLHPTTDEIKLEGVLFALADPVRLRIFVDLAQSEAAQMCSKYMVVDGREVPKSTLSKHFKILRELGLIYSERIGVTMYSTTRRADLDALFPGVLDAVITAHLSGTGPECIGREGVETGRAG